MAKNNAGKQASEKGNKKKPSRTKAAKKKKK